MDIITFGKHKGLTIDRVCHVDPDYVYWMKDVGLCDQETVNKMNRSELNNDKLTRGKATVFTWN